MKILHLYLFLFVAFLSHGQISPEVMTLVRNKDFFTLRETADKSPEPASRLFASALAANSFGRNEESNRLISELLQTWKPVPGDSSYVALMECNIDNHYKLFQYAEAAEAISQLLRNSGDFFDEEKKNDLLNSLNIWKAMAGTPPQQIVHTGPVTIPFTRDMAKLVNIPVSKGNVSQQAVFDTGANLSVMCSSTADQFGLQYVADSIVVKSITGKDVIARIGVTDEISVGGIRVLHPFFLVFDDADLTFGGVYKINVIIGFPVIMQLGEVEFNLKNNEISVRPASSAPVEKNLCLDGLTPLIRLNINGQPVMLSFDSGADRTMFYPRFYEMIRKNRRFRMKESTTSLGGAGGIRTVNVFDLEKVELDIMGRKVMLSNVDVFPEPLGDKKEHLHGNLGQDVLNSGGSYVINLAAMYFQLKD